MTKLERIRRALEPALQPRRSETEQLVCINSALAIIDEARPQSAPSPDADLVERVAPPRFAELQNWFFQKLDRQQRNAFFVAAGVIPNAELADTLTAGMSFQAFRVAIEALTATAPERHGRLREFALGARPGDVRGQAMNEAATQIERLADALEGALKVIESDGLTYPRKWDEALQSVRNA